MKNEPKNSSYTSNENENNMLRGQLGPSGFVDSEGIESGKLIKDARYNRQGSERNTATSMCDSPGTVNIYVQPVMTQSMETKSNSSLSEISGALENIFGLLFKNMK